MSQQHAFGTPPPPPIETVPVYAEAATVRRSFLMRTYAWLAAAVAGFAALQWWLFQTELAYDITLYVLDTSWLLILGAFLLVMWLGSTAAHRLASKPAQIGALALIVVAQALIFAPLLVIAEATAGDGVIGRAAALTALGFAGLTGIAVTSAKDFTKLGSLLRWSGVVALLAIVGAVLFGFELGTWFSVAMIAFAGGAILYDTDKVLHHYPRDREVGAAIELFISVMLLFWYVVRLLSRR